MPEARQGLLRFFRFKLAAECRGVPPYCPAGSAHAAGAQGHGAQMILGGSPRRTDGLSLVGPGEDNAPWPTQTNSPGHVPAVHHIKDASFRKGGGK